jgi:hypothetical protein
MTEETALRIAVALEVQAEFSKQILEFWARSLVIQEEQHRWHLSDREAVSRQMERKAKDLLKSIEKMGEAVSDAGTGG